MSTNVFNIADVARLIGISRTQAFSELASWPHQRTGTEISFTADDVAEIKRLMNAGPEEQEARRQLIEDKRAEVRALDAERDIDQSIKDYAYDHEALADEPNH